MGVAGNCCFSIGSVGQSSGTCSANRASTCASRRAASLTPVSGIEPAPQIPHPSASTQDRHSRAAPLPLQAIHAVVGLQAGGFEFDSARELVDRRRRRDIDQLDRPARTAPCVGRLELLRGAGDGVDVIGGDRTVLQRLGQLRCRVNVAERSVVLDACPSDVFAASAIVFSGNDSTCRNGVTRPGVLGVAPRLRSHEPRPGPTRSTRHPQPGRHAPLQCAPPARSPLRSPYRQP